MKSQNVWFPLHVGDYTIETRGLSFEERGIYVDMLCRYWHTQSPLPNDITEISKFLGISSKKLKNRAERIFPLFVERDGYLHHPGMDEEIIKYAELREKRAQAGKKGGDQKAKKFLASAKQLPKKKPSKCLANTTQNQTHLPVSYPIENLGVAGSLKSGEKS